MPVVGAPLVGALKGCAHRTGGQAQGLPLRTTLFFLLFSILYFLSSDLYAAEKSWDADEQEADWFEDANWFPQSAPTALDDATINSKNAAVNIAQTYEAKSITIGGTQTSTLTTNEFVSGVIEPDQTSDIAVLSRLGGTFKLKGAGTTRIRGKYKDSEETLTDQPSLVFYVK